MTFPKHITHDFDFAEAIALAELCQRATQIFAPEQGDPETRYNALFADQWQFAHALHSASAPAQVLIVRRTNSNQYAVVFHGRSLTRHKAVSDAEATGQAAGEAADAIPIVNLEDEAATGEANHYEPAGSLAYPPLAGELEPPPIGARVHGEWLHVLDARQAEIEDFFTTLVSANAQQTDAFQPNELEIHLTGHGGGGCLAALCALRLKRLWESRIDFPYFSLKMYSFGSPKFGNRAFADYYNGQMKGFSHRVQNLLDGAVAEPALAAPFPYNLELLLPGVDYVRKGDQYYMAYEHIGKAFTLAGVGQSKQLFNFRGPFQELNLLPFSHDPEGYRQMLIEAQRLQTTYWQPLQQLLAKADAQRKELVATWEQQALQKRNPNRNPNPNRPE